MKGTKQSKEYRTPEIKVLKTEESRKEFFVASGPKPVKATLSAIESW